MSSRPHRGRRFTNSRRNRTHHDYASDAAINDSNDQRIVLAATNHLEDPAKGAGTVVADPEYVQFADLTPCSLSGCSNQAVPEAYLLGTYRRRWKRLPSCADSSAAPMPRSTCSGAVSTLDE